MSFNSLKNKIIFKKYRVDKILGKGSFGCVFKGQNINDQSNVAIKAEKKNSKMHLLETESQFLSTLRGYGIPDIKSYGHSGKFYILVEELLGLNLSQLKDKSHFNIKDLAMLAIQIIDRIEYIHSKYIIHRDIKPENFTIGYTNLGTIYIIDFGISRKYKSSRTGKHLKYSIIGKLFGTVRYLSYNASRGLEQSRRDDLESIGYMLIHLANGKLPWQGLKLKVKNVKKNFLEMLYLKKFTRPEDLCKGLPSEFAEYIKYCKRLSFEQDPNYDYLRSRFTNILSSKGLINDIKFSWIINKKFKKNNNEYLSKEKYINILKRKQSPQIRLYRAIQNSLQNQEQSLKNINRIEKSCEQKKFFPNKKLNIDIYNRGASEDCKRRKIVDTSNISKETISYNSHFAQYNINISGFEDEKKIYQLYQKRNKIRSFTPDENNKNNIFNFYQNQIDSKLNIINIKDINKKSLNIISNGKNLYNSKKMKRNKFSFDLENFYFKEKIIIREIQRSLSEIIKDKKINKKKIPNEKKEILKKDYNLNKINKTKAINKNKINEILSCDINNTRKKNDKININLINKFNSGESEDSFSFKNLYIDKNIKFGRLNTNIYQKNDIEKIMNKNNNYNKNYSNNISKDINDNKKFQKTNPDNSTGRPIINTEKNKFKIDKILENKNIGNSQGINIIINNNVNNTFRKNYVGNISPIKQNQNYGANIKSENNQNIRKKEKISNDRINSNDKIIENDFNSYHYIRKAPKKNIEKQNINLMEYDEAKYSELNYYHPANNINNNQRINEKRYSDLSSSNLIKEKDVKYIENRRKAKLLEYKSHFTNKYT